MLNTKKWVQSNGWMEYWITFIMGHLALVVSRTSYRQKPPKVTLDAHPSQQFFPINVYPFLAKCHTSTMMKLVHKATMDIMETKRLKRRTENKSVANGETQQE